MTEPKIFVCVTTRDGWINHDIYEGIHRGVSGHRFWIGRAICSLSAAVARNIGVATFLGGDFTHLWFVDSDTLIPEGAVKKLIEVDANIVSGCTPTISAPVGHPHLNVTVPAVNGEKPTVWEEKWFKGVRESRYCGASCLLIRRSVFQTLKFPWFYFYQHWDEEKLEYNWSSEDMMFCDTVYKAGLGPIMAVGDVRCQHKRSYDISACIAEHED